MPKTKQVKGEVVQQLTDKLKGLKSGVFTDVSGLSVKKVEALRRDCWKEGVAVEVTKKTLLQKSFKDAGWDVGVKALKGEITLVSSATDDVAPARILKKVSKDITDLKVLGGLFNHEFIDVTRVMQVADLPSKDELLGKLVYVMKSPISGFAQVLNGNLRGLVTALAAIRDAK